MKEKAVFIPLVFKKMIFLLNFKILKGMDPVWYRSENDIAYSNSFKMKAAVIFGVV